MSLVVRFDGDPTFWSLNPGLDSQPMADQLATSTDPISVPVTEPLAGTMLISPRCAGSVAIFDQMMIGGWIPSGVKAPSSVLYVPTPAVRPRIPGYSLPEGTNLGELSQEIQNAMRTSDDHADQHEQGRRQAAEQRQCAAVRSCPRHRCLGPSTSE